MTFVLLKRDDGPLVKDGFFIAGIHLLGTYSNLFIGLI
jgi:hypothetical protein